MLNVELLNYFQIFRYLTDKSRPSWVGFICSFSIPALLLARLIPEWPLRNWIHIGVVCLTVTGIYVPDIRRLAPDSRKELFEQLVRLLPSGLQPRGFPVAGVAEDAIQRRSARFAEWARHTIIRRDASPAPSSPDPQPHHQPTPACPGAPR